MTKLGRNDPCHCGSGKKYKKCHLEADRRLPWAGTPPAADPVGTQMSEAPPASIDYKALPDRLRRLSKQGSAKDRKQFAKLLTTAEPMLDYMARHEEIGAASEALEAHRDAFGELLQSQERYRALVREVFAEERFAPFRFTAADVHCAFDHVGEPPPSAADEASLQALRAAILHLADPQRRSLLSLGLMAQLPDLVSEGRYLEGWLVQSQAADTADHLDEISPFLFQMFSFGYDDWVNEKRAKDATALHKLGIDLDRLRGMSPDEIEDWIRSQMSDPANESSWEAILREHPQWRKESEAKLEAMERDCIRLLEREDSHFLLLPIEEVEPWTARFNERFAQMGYSSQPSEEALSEDEMRHLFEETLLPLIREMADAIFTRDRLRQLVAELKTYRNDLFAAGDHANSELATGAMRYLEREDEPGLNTFLINLCWRSMEAVIRDEAGAQTADQTGNSSDAGERP